MRRVAVPASVFRRLADFSVAAARGRRNFVFGETSELSDYLCVLSKQGRGYGNIARPVGDLFASATWTGSCTLRLIDFSEARTVISPCNLSNIVRSPKSNNPRVFSRVETYNVRRNNARRDNKDHLLESTRNLGR